MSDYARSATWELNAIKRALSMHSWLNTPVENKRLADVIAELSQRRNKKKKSQHIKTSRKSILMPFTLNLLRWNAIESLPLPTGIGDLTEGLCAIARIVYASTGQVSALADADCIAPTIRAYMISLNDHLPRELRQRLGTLELARRVLAADTSPEAELRRAYLCADTAVRVFATRALRNAGLPNEANTLAALAPITNHVTLAAAFAVVTAAVAAAYAPFAEFYTANVAYAAAREAAAYAANVAYAATAAACAANAAADAAYAANAAAAAAADDAAWEPAFELLTALLVA